MQCAQADSENIIRQKIEERTAFSRQVTQMFRDIDESGTGKITYHELEAHLDNAQVCAYFEHLGLDPNDAWDLFKLLDVDATSQIDCEGFVAGCLRLRGNAKAIDVEKVHYENKIMRKRLGAFMRK